ncbi:MAG: HAD family hydrolase [Clostridia bacterium]|nr:HAD family hydrolase [Clostridia bacterium]
MKKGEIYVFDLDGTLVDSMPYFSKGILSIADDAGIEYGPELIKILTPLGYVGGARYYVRELGVKDTEENIVKRIGERLIYEYSNNVYLKPGVGDYLRRLRDEGARLFVLTASPHLVTDVCLQRNGVFRLFEKVWSVEDFGLTKSDTRLFYRVAETIGCENGDIHYFDDSLIALHNAKASGYITYGVYDAQTPDEVEAMKREYDFYVGSFEELL